MKFIEEFTGFIVREFIVKVYPAIMFFLFSFTLMRSMPVMWALKKLGFVLIRLLALVYLFGLYQDVKAQQLRATFMGGDTNGLSPAVYGQLQGEVSKPGGLAWSSVWTDSLGDMYVFGGMSFSSSGLNPNNRLFKYSNGSWIWLGGDSLNAAYNSNIGAYSGGEPNFGIKGVPSPNNQPGARYLATYWQGPNDAFYLFGGLGMGDGGAYGLLSDLWVFQDGMWTWIAGSSFTNSFPVHGSLNQGSSTNDPGSRIGAMGWSDSQGNSYIFGGQSLMGFHSDVMKWDGVNWTWLAGSSAVNQSGSIASGQPAARRFSGLSKAPDGTVYLHGGEQGGASTRFGDLWSWDGSTWTHLDGPVTPLSDLNYSGALNPGDRSDHQLFNLDTTLYLFGGFHTENGSSGSEVRPDLWAWHSDRWNLLRSANPNDPGAYGVLGQRSGNVFPAAVCNAMVASFSEGVYFLGGRLNGTSNFLDDLFHFDGIQFKYIDGNSGSVQAPELNGISSETVWPGSIESAAFCYDDNFGELYVFGGRSYHRNGNQSICNTLWIYDGKNWVWSSGDSSDLSLPSYGTKGLTSNLNFPGARENAAIWLDDNNILWLFGGYGLDANGNYGLLNDLWSYDFIDWTWVSGSSQIDDLGVCGAKGIGSSNFYPSSRRSMEVWVDNNGLAHLFGGYGFDKSNAVGYLNEFWTWDGSQWTWQDGDTLINVPANYGQKGVSQASNFPGARCDFLTARSDTGFFIYGGEGVSGQNDLGQLNELWYFDGSNWTFLSGDESQVDVQPSFEMATYNDASVDPGNLTSGAAWQTEHGLFLFGGSYRNGQSINSYSNNLWHWDGSHWAWLKGAQDQGVSYQKAIHNDSFEEGFEFHPPGLKDAVYWTDQDRSFLFGGMGVSQQLVVDESLNSLWQLDVGNYLKDGIWDFGSPANNRQTAQVIDDENISADLQLKDFLLDANFSLSGSGSLDLEGDIFNYGENNWQGDWRVSGTSQSEISGDTLEVWGLFTVEANSGLNTNGKLRIKANSAVNYGQLLNFGTVNGKLEFEYYLDLGSDSVDNARYFHLGSVLDSVEVGALDQGGVFNSGHSTLSYNTVWEWDAYNATWLSPSPNKVTSLGSGLMVYAGNSNGYNFLFSNGKSGVLRIRGYARNGNYLHRSLLYNDGQSSTATFAGGTGQSATEGWNLLANPFPHNVDVQNVLGDFRNKSIYIWDGVNYRSFVNGVSVNGGSSLLAPGQAFYYQVASQNQRSGPLDFTFERSGSHANGSTSLLKVSSPEDIIKVKLTSLADTSFKDEILVRLGNSTDTGFHGGYEAWKIQNQSAFASLAAVKEDGQMAVALWDVDSTAWLPLHINAPDGGAMKLSFDVSHLFSGASFYLHDLQLDRTMLLGYNSIYSFYNDSMTSSNRFFISSTSSLAEISIHEEFTQWFSSKEGVYLKIPLAELAGLRQIKILDPSGRVITVKDSDLNPEMLVLTDAPQGLYFVYIIGDENQECLKVFRQ